MKIKEYAIARLKMMQDRRDYLYKQGLMQSARECNKEMKHRSSMGGFKSNKEMHAWLKENPIIKPNDYKTTGLVDEYTCNMR